MASEFEAASVAALAPQAAGNTWYPNSFLAPSESNEPGLSSGLQAVGDAPGVRGVAGRDAGLRRL